jgi:hypothetical protein
MPCLPLTSTRNASVLSIRSLGGYAVLFAFTLLHLQDRLMMGKGLSERGRRRGTSNEPSGY